MYFLVSYYSFDLLTLLLPALVTLVIAEYFWGRE